MVPGQPVLSVESCELESGTAAVSCCADRVCPTHGDLTCLDEQEEAGACSDSMQCRFVDVLRSPEPGPVRLLTIGNSADGQH
eukprot:SAG22_NODE_7729_length_713_cov_1.677524_1_plen_81_part_10